MRSHTSCLQESFFAAAALTILGVCTNWAPVDLQKILSDIPWGLYAAEVLAKIEALTSLPGYPFVPWFLAIASLTIAMTPFRNARQYGKTIASWLNLFLLASCISILFTGIVYANDIVSATHADVFSSLLYPLAKSISGFFFSGFFIMGQIQLQTPRAEVTNVFDEAEAAFSTPR